MENNEVLKSPTKLTSGWKIKIKSNASSTQQQHIPALPIVESDSAFNQRIDQWSKTPNFISMFNHLQKDVQKDMDRRRQQQQHRVDHLDKNTRMDLKKENSNNNNTTSTSTSTTNNIQHNGQKINNNNNNINPFVFEKPSILSKNEYEAWFYSKNDSIHHPHQWLKLASLFHIHPKTAYQRSLLQSNCLSAAQKDRQVTKEINEKQLENYLDLRQAQNRKYAQDAVNEGIKLYEQQKNKEALDFYKRALDMDPQYADGWYHVAQSLLQEKRTNDAILQLKRALKIEPNHEKAKTLLCTLENTTTYRDDKKVESGQHRINNMDLATKKSKIDITDTNEILMDESSDEESKSGSKKRHRHSEKHKKKRKYKHRSISPRPSSSKRKRYSSEDSKDEMIDDNRQSDHDRMSSDNGNSVTTKDNNNIDHRHHRHSSSSKNKHRHSYHDTKHKSYSSSSSKHKHDGHDHDHDKHHRHHRTSRHETSSSSREKSKERSSKHYSSRHSHGYHRRH
ncbi:hypothetical protein BJ944DRAFT_237517 [Cunninghamella echinulata]|nr:hypothetical protein BJ944DRAFT_237517 [Cunninghamella echinulata]